jgi:hypothetical protein
LVEIGNTTARQKLSCLGWYGLSLAQ